MLGKCCEAYIFFNISSLALNLAKCRCLPPRQKIFATKSHTPNQTPKKII